MDDDEREPDEYLTVKLLDSENASLGWLREYVYWIFDNDSIAQQLRLFKQDVNTTDGKKLFVIGPKTYSVNLRGIAVDRAGNIYISDQGPTRGDKEGAILMWPRGREEILRILTGLSQPGDIELSPDQTALIVAGKNGTIERYPFGISIRITNIDPTEGHTRVHVFSRAAGEKVARVSPDGYFHFMGLLVPEQKGGVDVIIEHNGKTRHYVLPLGQPGSGDNPFGQTVVDLTFY